MLGRAKADAPEDVGSDNPPVLNPAGRLHLTFADWAKFRRLFLNRGADLLKPSTIEHLLRVPAGRGRGVAMGWASATSLDGASFAMQGSNSLWAATAVVDTDSTRSAMIVANDGRIRVLTRMPRLATQILSR